MAKKINLEKFNKRLSKEFKDILKKAKEQAKKQGVKLVDYIIEYSYMFACYHEVIDLFQYMDEEEYEEDFQQLVEGLKPLLVLESIYNDYREHYDPENVNFFCYADLKNIIQHFFNCHQQ